MQASTQTVFYNWLGLQRYAPVWTMQESLLAGQLALKKLHAEQAATSRPTVHQLLLLEHYPVYTLGKSGKQEHILISEEEMQHRGIEYFHINRGGDITFHGPGQLVAYPILDLEKFKTDIGLYLRNLEEVIIRILAEYGLTGERSTGETGVWLDAGTMGRERKICAIGVRCSRWVTMHGLAFNVNTHLDYFDHIVPCGIHDKSVTSLEKELGRKMDMQEVVELFLKHFSQVFGVELKQEQLEVAG